MRRRLFTLLSAASLLLCGAACVLWAESGHRVREIVLPVGPGGDVAIVSNDGELGLTILVVVPHAGVVEATCVLPVAWLVCLAIRRRPVAGTCQSCGYDLRASAGRCPECGADPSRPAEGDA